MLRKNKLLFFGLIFLSLLIMLIFSKTYNAVFVDELIYCRWIYRMVFERLDYLLPIQWGKQPLFFWLNRFWVTIFKNISSNDISILNVLKLTAISNLLITVFCISLYFKKRILKLIIPICFILGPFFLIYFSIGMVENVIIPVAVLYWHSLGRFTYFIEHKNKWRTYYLLTILLGLMVSLTKSNSSGIIISSIIISFFYILKDNKKNIWKWIGLLFIHIFLLTLNLYIAFHFSLAESNNVMSFKPSLNYLFTNITYYVSYIPYFFSFSFLFMALLILINIRKKELSKLISLPLNIILIINLIINFIMLLFLKVYYPRYYLIFFLSLFLLIAKSFENINLYFLKRKILIGTLALFLLFDLVFVGFSSLIYKWRIPRIDVIQHFDRSSVHIPYDFKKNVINKNPKVTFLINDERYGANNLFYSLIPVSIKYPNFKTEVYEDIDKFNSDLLCKQYPNSLIYIWGDSSITKNKQIMKKFLFKSYYTFNKSESVNIYKINCI